MTTTKTFDIELKNVKIAQYLSEETTAFAASIYVDGKKAGTAKNDGHGGPNFVDWNDNELGRQVEAWANALPACKSDYSEDGLSMNMDFYISMLIEKHDLFSQIKRWIKKNVVFRLKGDDEGAWRQVGKRNANDAPAVIKWIKDNNKNIEVIISTNDEAKAYAFARVYEEVDS